VILSTGNMRHIYLRDRWTKLPYWLGA